MKLINIGFGNLVSAERLLTVVSPDSAPVKRLVQEAKERAMLIDASFGRKTRAVLVMDTDHVILSAITPEAIARRLLEARGMAVDTAANGREALEAFSRSPTGFYDLVLMDIRMPVMDGLAAARAIRRLERPDAASVPILAMSANAFEEDRETSRAAGMNAHLAKPVEPAELYDTIGAFMK